MIEGSPQRTQRAQRLDGSRRWHEVHGEGWVGPQLLSTVRVYSTREREREKIHMYVRWNVRKMYAYTFIPPTNRSVYRKTNVL